jgi:hypothetical protein
MHFQIESCVGASIQALDAHLFPLAIDGLNRMTIYPQFHLIEKPAMRSHIGLADRHQAYRCLRQDACFIRRTVVGLVAKQPRAGR